MKSLETLAALVPPPEKPEAIPMDYDWTTLEEVQKLSDSYKGFVAMYGAGIFGDHVNFFTPSPRTVFNIHIATDSIRAVHMTLLLGGANIPDLVRADCFFPVSKMGLFVVADSVDGHSVFYARTGRVQRENVILYDSHREVEGVALQFDLSVVEFFASIYSGRLELPGFSTLLRGRQFFKPLRTSWLHGTG